MNLPVIKYCPGTLAEGFDTYSRTCMKRVFDGRKVSHVLPYVSPSTNELVDEIYDENRGSMSLSGVQEKFSVLLEKNHLRLTREGERGTYILKPIPNYGKKADQMPANEHLTMQIARQIYGIETAENALMFFKNGQLAYITRRFDVDENGHKRAQEDFASLAGRTPQSHGANYKYLGNYLEVFQIMQQHLPAHKVESLKLMKLLLFNFLFSNGDAHLKNFSILETAFGDFRLSPAYDLLNSRIHVDDKDFALDDGLLPRPLSRGSVSGQFAMLCNEVGLPQKMYQKMVENMLTKSSEVEKLIEASFLNINSKRTYWQHYQGRLKQMR